MSASKEHMQQNDLLKDRLKVESKPELKIIKDTHKDTYVSSRDLYFLHINIRKSKTISSNAASTSEIAKELSEKELHDYLAMVVRLEKGTVAETDKGYIFSIHTGNSEQHYKPASIEAIALGLQNYLEKNECGNGMNLSDLLKTACIPIKSSKSLIAKNTKSKP